MKHGLLISLLLVSFVAGYCVRDFPSRVSSVAAQEAEVPEKFVPWNPSLRGDANGDGRLNMADGIFILNYCFRGGASPGLLPVGGLPATTQKFCWSGTQGELQDPCPSPGEDDYGQDLNFKAGIPRSFELVKEDEEDPATWYTIDHATGLMWQYRTDPERKNWRDALKSVETLELGGFTDWRMPNIFELFSILDVSTQQPAVNKEFFNVLATVYWSSTTCIFDTSRAYTVRFNNGYVNCSDKGGQGFGGNKIFSVFVRNVDS